MNVKGTATRLPTSRKAAALLLACTLLYSPQAAFAQTALTPRPGVVPSTDATPSGNPATDSEASTASVAPAPQLWRPSNNPGDPISEQLEDAGQPYADAENPYEPTVDGGENPRIATEPGQTPGIRLGTFLLRPSISQTINTEKQTNTGGPSRRNYLTTGIRGTLTSDWSRHALTVTGDGAWERNFGSKNGEEPRARIEADLRLDLGEETRANLKAGYEFSREGTTDPNALSGASVQGGEHRFTTGASIERDFGKLRGLAALDLSRTVYTDAKGLNGQPISLSDRDQKDANLRGRIGYELSPALIPFLELNAGTTKYDRRLDNSGYARSSNSYGAKIGTEVDLGEKTRGEAAIGYLRKQYDDDRLAAIGALTLDGELNWSPQRGTNVNLGLRTMIEDFAGGPQGGWISYRLDAGLTHELRSDLVARLTGQIVHRTFPSSDTENAVEYTAGAGLTWGLNRYLDLTADVSYQWTPVYDSSELRVGAGLVLKR
ncbi:polysaccharide biosynthesis protein UppP [Rhizobium nepotum]|uniref:polysaccharide biosynthesis protein UppP n=1 Tax=Rhizobium nepotum TaxID=1035271 RepID=UPI003CF5385C